MNQPEFETLRKFIVYELNMMISDYAQSFFESNHKDRASGFGNVRMALRVRQVVVKGKHLGICSVEPVGKSSRSYNTPHFTKLPPVCFVYN